LQHDRKDPLAVTATAARVRQIAGQLRLNEGAFTRALALSGAIFRIFADDPATGYAKSRCFNIPISLYLRA
jgi:hypothetical protein